MTPPLVVFCAQRPVMQRVWSDWLGPRFVNREGGATLVRTPEELDRVLAIQEDHPCIVFCTDWSWRIAAPLLKQHRFIGFHAADLPAYRGGTPIQHQIRDGLTETKLCAFSMTEVMDGGDVLLREPLSLSGTIADIWSRIGGMVGPMVLKILAGDYVAAPQPPANDPPRNRLTPNQSQLPDMNFTLQRLYDLIRSLDGSGYPPLFVQINGKKIEFRDAVMVGNVLGATIKVTDV